MYIKTDGIVLREVAYQDSDKLLTVLTREYGKLTVRARGVRSSRSRSKAACVLGIPMTGRVATSCRFRFVSSTVSWSISRRCPTPARQSASAAADPTPPSPNMATRARSSRPTPSSPISSAVRFCQFCIPSPPRNLAAPHRAKNTFCYSWMIFFHIV